MRNRRKNGIYLMILLFILSLVAVAMVINGENGGATVSMDTIDVPRGGNSFGYLKVNDVSNLGSFSVTLSWDPTVVNVVKVDDSDFNISNHIDHNAGFVNIVGYSMSSVSGTLNIARLKFDAVGRAGDTCGLNITGSEFLTADPTPVSISCVRVNGTAHITASSSGDNEGGGGTGSDGEIPTVPTNQPPVADASASQTSGFIGEPISFNGSLSSDSDGTIDLYEWDWNNDGSYDYSSSSATTTHSFDAAGTYPVTLRVTDNGSAADEDTVNVIISKANTPPTKPVVNGPTSGHQNIIYTYTVVSTDADNDTIQYIFDWGDDSGTTTTDFLQSGISTAQTHSWVAPGRYVISVKAYDNETLSGVTKYTVLIDVHYVKDIGYLVDNNSDGVYDSFYNNSTGDETGASKQVNDTYLVDNNGDNSWDYIYNADTDTLTKYAKASTSGSGPDNTALYALLVIIILLLIIFGYLLMKRKG